MQYTSMQKGLADLVGGILNGGNPMGVDPATYLNAMARRAQLEAAGQQGRMYGAKTDLINDQLDARRTLRAGMPAVVSPPSGPGPGGPAGSLSPSQALYLALAGSNPNPDQVSNAMLTSSRAGYLPEAVTAARGGQFDTAAALNAIVSGIQTPAMYTSGDQGQIFGTMTGSQVNAGALPEFRAKLGAEAGTERAHAGAYSAAAAASEALAKQRGYITAGNAVYELPRGAQPGPAWPGVPYAPPQAGGPLPQVGGQPGNIDPTNAAKQYAEMLRLGVPEAVALGVAYGTIQQVRDIVGNVTLVDLRSNQPIGAVKNGVWVANQAPGAPGGAGMPPPPPGFNLDRP